MGMTDDEHPNARLLFHFSLRRRGISDQRVLRAMEAVPRDAFVDAANVSEAYADTALPIACGQTISQPFIVAFMTEQLDVRPSHRVLEIGTGSGYQAAVLSGLCREVVSIERYRTLADAAREKLQRLKFANVTVSQGDGLAPAQQLGSFERIIVTAAVERIGDTLRDRLDAGGILIAPVGPQHGVQTLMKVSRTDQGFMQKELLNVRFVPALPGLAREL